MCLPPHPGDSHTCESLRTFGIGDKRYGEKSEGLNEVKKNVCYFHNLITRKGLAAKCDF